MLDEVVDGARALTGARYGVIATVYEAGGAQEFVISGFPPNEARKLAAWPEAPRLFEHLRSLEAPFRAATATASASNYRAPGESIPIVTFPTGTAFSISADRPARGESSPYNRFRPDSNFEADADSPTPPGSGR